VQASNNRFKESLMLTMFSAFTRGFANITANNQATHCLLAQAQLQPQLLVSTGNLVLSDPEGKVCGGISP
jgi:hypothetical protein